MSPSPMPTPMRVRNREENEIGDPAGGGTAIDQDVTPIRITPLRLQRSTMTPIGTPAMA